MYQRLPTDRAGAAAGTRDGRTCRAAVCRSRSRALASSVDGRVEPQLTGLGSECAGGRPSVARSTASSGKVRTSARPRSPRPACAPSACAARCTRRCSPPRPMRPGVRRWRGCSRWTRRAWRPRGRRSDLAIVPSTCRPARDPAAGRRRKDTSLTASPRPAAGSVTSVGLGRHVEAAGASAWRGVEFVAARPWRGSRPRRS